ncbi:MAG: HNH endonuclease [Gammaproteobacteria bacterium]
MTKILKLDVGGRPIEWITCDDGARLYCRDQVAWEAGEAQFVLRGGISSVTGQRSVLHVNSIIATNSLDRRADDWRGTPLLTNAALFRRDDYLCMYCGVSLSPRLLTRDHVVPVSKGGQDTWVNVVSACKPCNQRKDNTLLEDTGMTLLATPYAPNRAEGLILENRTILADQMAFLRSRLGSTSRLRT